MALGHMSNAQKDAISAFPAVSLSHGEQGFVNHGVEVGLVKGS